MVVGEGRPRHVLLLLEHRAVADAPQLCGQRTGHTSGGWVSPPRCRQRLLLATGSISATGYLHAEPTQCVACLCLRQRVLRHSGDGRQELPRELAVMQAVLLQQRRLQRGVQVLHCQVLQRLVRGHQDLFRKLLNRLGGAAVLVLRIAGEGAQLGATALAVVVALLRDLLQPGGGQRVDAEVRQQHLRHIARQRVVVDQLAAGHQLLGGGVQAGAELLVVADGVAAQHVQMCRTPNGVNKNQISGQ